MYVALDKVEARHGECETCELAAVRLETVQLTEFRHNLLHKPVCTPYKCYLVQ